MRVRKQDGERLVVFVSCGGQDRCSTAKAITKHLLVEDKFTLNVRPLEPAPAPPRGMAELSRDPRWQRLLAGGRSG